MAQDFGTLGRLVVSLEANIAQFQSDLGRAEYQMQQFGTRIDAISGGATSALKGIGLAMAGMGAGLSLAAIEDKFHSITSGLANLKDMSEKTGASVENLSALAAIARVAGVDLTSVETGAIKLAKALAGADDTAKGAGHALDFLGLSAKQLRGMDTADAMKLVADQLESVKDGGSKTAIAMDIFGKSGAQLLPYLHDLARNGDLVAKVFDDQAEAAKNYEQDVKRLTLSKDQLYKTITIAVLPAMDSLVKVLINANNETNGLRKAAKDLAADGSINAWAESAAVGVGHLMDEFILIKYLVEQAIIPFERLGKNIENLGVSFGILTSGDSVDEMKQAYAQATADSQKFYAELDRRKNAPMPSPHYADDIKAQFAKDKATHLAAFEAELDEILYGEEEIKKRYTSRAPTDGKTIDSTNPYEAFVSGLQKRATGLDQGEIARLQLQSEQSAKQARDKGFTPNLAAGASGIAGVQSGEFGKLDFNYEVGLKKQLAAENERLTVVGKTAHEQELLNIQNKNQLDLQDKIAQFEKTIGPLTIDQRTKMTAKEQEYTDKMIASANARYEAERKWSTGSKTAMDSYVESITNAAAQSNRLFTNAFKGMEDALVNFVKTGKLDFKSLADSIVTDLIRIQVQNSIMKPLVGTADSPGILSQGLSALGKGITSLFGGGRASGGDVLPGQYYVVGENGPEILVPTTGGTVIPNGGGSTSPSLVVQQHIYPSPGVNAGDLQAAMVQAKNAAIAEIYANRRHGGVFA